MRQKGEKNLIMRILHSKMSQRFCCPVPSVPKITVSINDRDHLSLKLLAILENKNIGNVLIEAVREHIKSKGADKLGVQATKGQLDTLS